MFYVIGVPCKIIDISYGPKGDKWGRCGGDTMTKTIAVTTSNGVWWS